MIVSTIEYVQVEATHTHDGSGCIGFTGTATDMSSGLPIEDQTFHKRNLLTLLGRPGRRYGRWLS